MACNGYEVEVRRNPYTDPADDVKKAVKEAMNVEWHLNEDTMKRIKTLGKDKLKVLLGWVDPDSKPMSKDRREAVEGKNRAVERSIESLFELDETIQQRKEDYLPTSVYFDWFVAKSGRMMIDSAGVNIQSDKLHRFLFQTKKQETRINPNNKKQMDIFKMAIAQAFGFAIDKKTQKESIEFADKILAVKGLDTKVMYALENGKKKFHVRGLDEELEIEFLGQMLTALDEIKKFNKSNGKPFITKLTIETDALTSGFGLKILQMPLLGLEESKKWLAKTGIIVGDRSQYKGMATEGGMNDITGKGFTDSYKTLAKNVGTTDDIVNALSSALLDTDKNGNPTVFADKVAKDLGLSPNEEGAAKARAMLTSMETLLPKIVDENDDVTEDGRKLFKGPFMTFNYGAGWTKIMKELAFNTTDDIVQKILDYSVGVKTGKIERNDTFDNIIRQLGLNKLTVNGSPVSIVEAITNNDLKNIKNKDGIDIKTLIGALVGGSYGSRVRSVLESEFKQIVDTNNAINGTIKLLYRTFSKLMQEELDNKGIKNPTIEQELEIFEKFKDTFPILRSPLGKSIEDGIAIFSTKMDYKRAERTPGTQLKKGFRGTQSIRRYLDEAGAAGSVIPIHTLDASIMALTMLGRDALEVHDALVLGIGQVEDTAYDYNKNLINISQSWNMLEEVHKALIRANKKYPKVLDSVIQEERIKREDGDFTAIDSDNVINTLNDSLEKANTVRKEIFNESLEIHNMVFNEDSGYTTKPSTIKPPIGQIIESLYKSNIKAELKQEIDKIRKDLQGCE